RAIRRPVSGDGPADEHPLQQRTLQLLRGSLLDAAALPGRDRPGPGEARAPDGLRRDLQGSRRRLEHLERHLADAGRTRRRQTARLAVKLKPSIGWLYAFIPITIVLERAHAPDPVVFFSAALAIVPIAALIVESTEQIAHRTGDAIGGLLNAT